MKETHEMTQKKMVQWVTTRGKSWLTDDLSIIDHLIKMETKAEGEDMEVLTS